MLDRIIRWSLDNRVATLFGAAVLLALGAWANALAAGNETSLLKLGAAPLYPWKSDARVSQGTGTS